MDTSAIFPRLVPASAARTEPDWDYATEALPDTATVYVHDAPDGVSYLDSDLVARHGADAVAQAAFDNLHAVTFDAPDTLDGELHVVTGEHAGTAALILPDVLPRLTGEAVFPDGVLFACPTSYVLLVHVPRPGGVDAGLRNLAVHAAGEFEYDELRRITPSTFWWDGLASAEQVTTVENREISVDMSGPFGTTFARLSS